MKKKNNYLFRQISLEALAVTLLFIASLFIFFYIADENVLENNNTFDKEVMAYVALHSTPQLVYVMRIVTFFGSSQFLFPAYILLLVYFLWKKNRAYAIDIGVIAISSTTVMFLLKQLFKRRRPDVPIVENVIGYSFPSGHSVSSFIFCAVLAHLVWMSGVKLAWKHVAVVSLLLLSVTIGFSRIVLNVHFATDVIAGFCVVVVGVWSSVWVIKKTRKKSPKTKQAAH